MAVVFDCSSNMAMFCKPYTTTSSVSFAFPPPTAVAGLISAIVGTDNGAAENAARSEYWKSLAGTSVAISILQNTSWLRAAINFRNVKNPQTAPHIQVKHQFVAFPRYRIYVKGELEEKLKRMLEKGNFVYTPFLGVAYAVAQIDYRGECSEIHIDSERVEISSVLPWKDDMLLDFTESAGIFSETVPFRMDEERRLLESVKVIYSAESTKPLRLKKTEGKEMNDIVKISAHGVEEVIAWFPAW